MKKILKTIGIISLYLLVYLIAQISITVIFTIIFGIRQAIFHVQFDIDQFVSQYMMLIMILSTIITSLFYLIMILVRDKKLTDFCRFSKIKLIHIILCILVGVSLNLLTTCAINVSKIYQYFPTDDSLIESTITHNNLFTLLVFFSILVPIFEEILFRGLIFHEMKTIMRVIWAIPLQAVLFGVYHLNIVQGIYASVLGILLVLAYQWTGSLWASILIHGFFNGTSMFVNKLMYMPFVERHQVFVLITSFAVVLLLTYFIWRNRLVAQEENIVP